MDVATLSEFLPALALAVSMRDGGNIIELGEGVDETLSRLIATYPIGFDFSFYGVEYSEFRVCSNGWMSFTSTSTDYSNDPLPATGAPENLLAVFWDDLVMRDRPVDERDGRFLATADLAEDSRDVGVGDTPTEAVRAALKALGEPYASEMSEAVVD